MTGQKAADSDVRMLIATQVAYLDGAEGMTVGELVDRVISNYGNQANLSGKQKAQLDYAQYIQTQIEKYNLPDCNNWVIKEVADDNAQSGFYGCLIDTGDGDAVLGFRGSESFDMHQKVSDWAVADFGLLNSTGTEQQQLAAEFTQYVNDVYGDTYGSYSFTGHSLGGNLAEHATLTAPEGMPVHRCVNLDGPGYSNEYIAAHQADIARRSAYIDHYQYSLVGSLLIPVPGSHYQTIAAHNDEGLFGGLVRHHTRNIEFDEYGNVQQGERDALAHFASPISKALELTDPDFILWLTCPQLMILQAIVERGPALLHDMKETAKQVVETIVTALQNLKQNISNWFRNMFGVALTGEFEVNVSYVNSLGTGLEGASRKLSRISRELSDVARGLRYNSIAGACFRSKLRIMSNTVTRDANKASSLAGAVRNCAQISVSSDTQVAQVCKAV